MQTTINISLDAAKAEKNNMLLRLCEDSPRQISLIKN